MYEHHAWIDGQRIPVGLIWKWSSGVLVTHNLADNMGTEHRLALSVDNYKFHDLPDSVGIGVLCESGELWSAPSHYLNQCWNIVNWSLGSKLQWNTNRKSHIFIQENAFEPVVRPETPLSIILSLACKSDIKEAHSVFSNPLFKK